jgi:hypothetical protein
MNKHLIAVMIAASAAIAAPAFASSGYGPAPHYNPIVGAPASQRGESAATIHAENANANANANASAFGGVAETTFQSGSRAQGYDAQSLYAHH